MFRFSMGARTLIFAIVLGATASAEEGIMPFVPEIHPVVQEGRLPNLPNLLELQLFRDMRKQLAENFAFQSPVKSQGNRGTCSIFASIAALEWFLNAAHQTNRFDLSEQYLNFVVKSKVWPSTSDGSNSGMNHSAVLRFGVLEETTMPYNTRAWTKEPLEADLVPIVSEVCRNYDGFERGQCRVAQRSPNDDTYFDGARKLAQSLGLQELETKIVWSESEVKQLLGRGEILILEVEFFYRAWAHSRMTEYGLGARDFARFQRGEVLTPDAEDIRLSRLQPAGHAIVLLGYDDEKQVYYFKNSWGAQDFGLNSNILENAQSTAGYGTISYDYVHNHGTFYSVYSQN